MATNVEPHPELLLANLRHELDAADLYRYLATKEKDGQRAAILTEMAASEDHHADVMAQGLRGLGVAIPAYKPTFQTRLLKALAGMFGPKLIYPLLHGAEISGTQEYLAQEPNTAALAGDERSHARTLGELSRATGRSESWHRSGGGGTLRASVFGVSDGLVSNLSLVMGFAGAGADAGFVVLAGMAGLMAGAGSMAAGEYVSMKAQRELFERQIELEAAELSVTPQEEIDELALIYRAKGLDRAEAERLARRLAGDRDVALDVLVREELGLNPDELGSPYGAAIGSFLSFAAGAVLPVLPYFFGAGTGNVAVSLAISGVGLFGIGAALSLFTGRNVMFSGARQLLIGAATASLTFLIGSIIGVSAA